MDRLTRRTFFGSAAIAAGAAMSGCSFASRAKGATSFAYGKHNRLRVTVPGLAQDVRVLIVGDTHLDLSDGRDAEYAGYYKRLKRNQGHPEAFRKMIAKVKDEKPDILLLAGDIMSFPTLANVEFLKSTLDESGLNWFYVAGNHDWHFEGVQGSDEQQREQWIAKRLMPLYQGRDPLMSSCSVKGMRFVAIDNSVYHVNERQLEFWKSEAAKGESMVLFMHIPLWTEGWGLFTCGNPGWGAATDPYWEIERREKWAPSQSPSTFAFREAVLSTPNLAAVFSGHIHQIMTAVERGKFMFSVPDNRKGAYVDARFTAG